MTTSLGKNSGRFTTGLLAGALLGLAVAAGVILVVLVRPETTLFLPQQMAYATASDSSQTMVAATGQIDENAEGLFTLDFLTGELYCTVLSHRLGKFNARFRANVIRDLGLDKDKTPRYLMVTGRVDFPRGAGTARAAQSVVYVIDGNSGKFAAYGIPWRKELASQGRPQAGALLLLDGGDARMAAIRQ